MAVAPPYDIMANLPEDDDFIRTFPATERLFRDTVESWLTQIADPTNGFARMPIGATASLNLLTQPLGGTRYDVTRKVLQVQIGAGVWEDIGFPSGTRAIFFQSDAPAGWVKLTDVEVPGLSDSMVALSQTSAGAAGSTGISTVLTSRTITQANLPNVAFTVTGTAASAGSHSHGGATATQSANHTHTAFENVDTSSTTDIGAGTVAARERGGAGDGKNYELVTAGGVASVGVTSIESTSHTHGITADGAHTHTVSGTAASGGSGTAMNFDTKKLYCILCQKL